MMMGTHCHLMVAQCCLPSLERIPRSAGPITTVAMQRRWPKFVARCHRRCSLPSRCDQIYRAVDWPPGWQCHGSGTRGTLPVAVGLICGVPWAWQNALTRSTKIIKAIMLRFRIFRRSSISARASHISEKKTRFSRAYFRYTWPMAKMPSIEASGCCSAVCARHIASHRRQGVAPHPAGLPCRQSADKAPLH